jgi:hypothetical protein
MLWILRICAVVVVVGGLSVEVTDSAFAQEIVADARSVAVPVEHEFTGVSEERSFDVALRDALRQMDEAVRRHGRHPCTAAKWRVVEIGGEAGGPAGVNTLEVRIAAAFEAREGDPVGTWKVTRSAGDEEMAGFTLTLRREGEELMGTVKWPDGQTSAIGAASFRDGKLWFRVTPGSAAQEYSGTLLGDTITGKYWAAGLDAGNWAVGIGMFAWRGERESSGKAGE